MKKLNSLVLDSTVTILDYLYRDRPFPRFWVLEVIARAPYFAFISVLHFRESLGLRGEEHIFLMKDLPIKSSCIIFGVIIFTLVTLPRFAYV